MAEQFYTYILECGDGTWYTGWTTDLNRRVAVHNRGQGAKYTRSRLPVTLIYSETFGTKQEAMQREWSIKQLTRSQKEALVNHPKCVLAKDEKLLVSAN